MEITKREILFSTIIIAVMIGLGILISRPIISSVSDNALKVISSLQITNNEKFDYIRRTNAGDFIAQGKLTVIDPVSIKDISGTYGRIEKVKKEYREHTRTVTETDSEGNTITRTETYWEWDVVDEWSWEATEISFLGQVFTPDQIKYRFRTTYKETIEPRVGFFSTEIRYDYYVAPKEDYGIVIGTANNKNYTNLHFKHDTIKNYVLSAENRIESAPIIFWIIWGILIIGIIILFFYAENRWLYESSTDYREM